MNSQLTDDPDLAPALADELRGLFLDRLDRFGIVDIVFVPERDHADHPAIMVEVKHRKVNVPVDLREVIAVDQEARRLALARGERRFLYVHHEYDDEQKLAGVK